MKLTLTKPEYEALLAKYGSVAAVARSLGVERPRLYEHMKEIGVKVYGKGKPSAGATGLEKAKAKLVSQLEDELESLTTDEERVLWYARQGVEPRDIALKLGFGPRLANDSDFKTWFEDAVQQGLAIWRIELAQTIYAEAKTGQVTALREAARAHLEAYKDSPPSTDFAGGYKAKVQELLTKIYNRQHTHVRKRFKFEEKEE